MQEGPRDGQQILVQKCEDGLGDLGLALSLFKRLGKIEAAYTVADSDLAHDYPAVYRASDCEYGDPNVSEVVSFTHTYVEQARRWERIVCRGILESVTGKRNYLRILVGSSREAKGEYIKVLGSTWTEM